MARSKGRKSRNADNQQVEWPEFRYLLQSLREILELYIMFEATDADGDHRITLGEFEDYEERLRKWGVKGELKKIFNNLTDGRSMLFLEFADWALEQKLDLENSPDKDPDDDGDASDAHEDLHIQDSDDDDQEQEASEHIEELESNMKGMDEKELATEDEKKTETSKTDEIDPAIKMAGDQNDPDHEIKLKIWQAFEPFDSENNRTCDEREVRSIMRYLGAYPPEDEMQTHIINQIKEDEEIRVRYERFEEFMLNVMKNNLYEPDDHETLIQAFRILDTEDEGVLDETVIVDALTSNSVAFHEKEIEDFLSVAKDPKSGKINYEQYVNAMLSGMI
eukprot:CAMPEP_0197526826 /NCGR_PEP_ID=MMETSP1318-20131121/19509_1 /TAXON_ID=552666 /ORGANISM="Partenskyella glossopodia, Strain RCC365" /LENGTH=334 /DNA_ID=CAMNT_0043081183 /DNA_START=35 /DNA_END=1039 /DNA_ORIENTATION=-